MIFTMEVRGGNSIAVLASGGLAAAMDEAAQAAGELLADELRSFPFKTPSKDGEEQFKDSISIVSLGAGEGVSVQSDSDHAVFIEQGTRGGYEIKPRNGAVLVFDGTHLLHASSVLTGKVFLTKTIHPGIQDPPRPFATVMENNQQEVASIFASYVGNVLRDSAGL